MKKEEVTEKAKGVIYSGIKKIKKVFKGIKCSHSVNYTHIEGKPLCHKSGICLDCETEIFGFFHEHDEYKPNGPCVEVRHCIHCGEAEHRRIAHRYTKTEIDKECNVWGVCEVCGDKRNMREKVHQWEIVTEISKDSEYKGKESKICLRCGNEGGMFGGVKVKGKRVLKKIKRISIYIAVILTLLLFCWILL